MTIYVLYKTTSIETGEFYIGFHGIDTKKYPDFNDGYLGSGDRLKASIKKHGKKVFKRTLLALSEDSEKILSLEEHSVTQELIDDPLCLNIALGGRVSLRQSEKIRLQISEKMKFIQQKKVESGSHHLQGEKGRERAIEENQRRIENKTHNLLGPEVNQRRIDAGTHNFLSENIVKKECPYCHKIVDPANYAKSHGDKCKQHPNHIAPIPRVKLTHEERGEIIRRANLLKTKKECLHCHKMVDPANYAKWHGDKCNKKSK